MSTHLNGIHSSFSTVLTTAWPFEEPRNGHAPRGNGRDKGHLANGPLTLRHIKRGQCSGGEAEADTLLAVVVRAMSLLLLDDRNLSLALVGRTVSIFSWAPAIIAPCGSASFVVQPPPAAVNIRRRCLVPNVRVHKTHLQSCASAVLLHSLNIQL